MVLVYLPPLLFVLLSKDLTRATISLALSTTPMSQPLHCLAHGRKKREEEKKRIERRAHPSPLVK